MFREDGDVARPDMDTLTLLFEDHGSGHLKWMIDLCRGCVHMHFECMLCGTASSNVTTMVNRLREWASQKGYKVMQPAYRYVPIGTPRPVQRPRRGVLQTLRADNERMYTSERLYRVSRYDLKHRHRTRRGRRWAVVIAAAGGRRALTLRARHAAVFA